MGDIYDLSEMFILVLCCIFLYMQFGRSARVRVVKKEKVPTKNEIRRQHKKERRLRKIRRRLKIPYRGNARIIKYDKTAPYIESAWNEVEKEQHGKRDKKGRGV